MHRAKKYVITKKIIAAALIVIFGAAAVFTAALAGAPSIFAADIWDGRSKFPAFAKLGVNATEFSSDTYDAPYTINGFVYYLTTVHTSDSRTILAPDEKQAKKLVELAKESNGQIMINLDQPGYLANGGKSQTFRVYNPSWYTGSGSIQILLYSTRGSMEVTDQMISSLSAYTEYIDFIMAENNQFDIRSGGASIWQDGNVSMRIGLPYLKPESVDVSSVRLLEFETREYIDSFEYSNGWLYGILAASGKYDPAIYAERIISGDVYTVTASRLNVRSGPGTSFGKITHVSRGEAVSVIGYDGSWASIVLADGTVGWASTKYLSY